VLCLMIFIERALFLHKWQVSSGDFLNGIKNLVDEKRLTEALTTCEDTPGPMVRIVKSGLLNFGKPGEQIQSAIQTAAIVEIPLLERRVGTLFALSRIAPLLGFLGTLIAALQALYQLESINSDGNQFSQLLAEALSTSIFGVAIAVFATLGHHFLLGRVRALVHDFEWVGHTVYEILTTDRKELEELSKGRSDKP